jgi:hypothetical protein
MAGFLWCPYRVLICGIRNPNARIIERQPQREGERERERERDREADRTNLLNPVS